MRSSFAVGRIERPAGQQSSGVLLLSDPSVNRLAGYVEG